MKTKNMGITIFIFTCIFRHKVLEYPTNYQQHSQITGLYFHSNLTKVHSIPLHLHHRFSEQTVHLWNYCSCFLYEKQDRDYLCEWKRVSIPFYIFFPCTTAWRFSSDYSRNNEQLCKFPLRD